jgi:hypothetical protein
MTVLQVMIAPPFAPPLVSDAERDALRKKMKS